MQKSRSFGKLQLNELKRVTLLSILRDSEQMSNNVIKNDKINKVN